MGYCRRAGVVTLAVAAGLAVLLASFPVHAQGYDPDEEIIVPTRLEKMLTKLGRGLSNVMLGWVEIPATIDAKIRDGKQLGYVVSVAPVMGVTRAAMRTGAGVFEAATFAWPLKSNYDPVLKPEYVL